MNLRQTLNDKPAIGYAVAGVAAVVALVVVLVTLRGPAAQTAPDAEFFTVDDGQTYFESSNRNYAPYPHEGRTAYKALVFECDGERFVGYLERLTPEIREEYEALGDAAPGQGLIMRTQQFGHEVKRPGPDSEWVSPQAPVAYNEVISVPCPDGSGRAEPVFP